MYSQCTNVGLNHTRNMYILCVCICVCAIQHLKKSKLCNGVYFGFPFALKAIIVLWLTNVVCFVHLTEGTQ